MSESEVSDLIAKLQSFKKSEDRGQRKKLYGALSAFAASIEDESITQYRLFGATLQPIIAGVASDLKIFEILAHSDKPKTTTELAQESKADPALLSRILRYLASQFMIQQISKDLWEASNITRTLSQPATAAGLRFGYTFLYPTAAALPKFLAATSYANPTDSSACAFQIGHNTSETPFKWLASNPSVAQDFHMFMAETHKFQRCGFDVLPLEKLVVSTSDPSIPAFVDVGGGVGRSSAEFKERFPNIKGKIVNQDQEEALESALQIDGVEHQVYDFWTTQPVKGAKAYHLRRILHDWPDDKCEVILKNVSDAMSATSVLLIDEVVLPDTGAHPFASFGDLAMMACFAAKERTKSEFEGLLGRVGLESREVYRYEEESGESILVAVKK